MNHSQCHSHKKEDREHVVGYRERNRIDRTLSGPRTKELVRYVTEMSRDCCREQNLLSSMSPLWKQSPGWREAAAEMSSVSVSSAWPQYGQQRKQEIAFQPSFTSTMTEPTSCGVPYSGKFKTKTKPKNHSRKCETNRGALPVPLTHS